MPSAPHILLPILALTLALPSCGGSESSDQTPTLTPTPTAPPAVTWHGQVRPVIEESCLRCHTPGGVAPSDFSVYEQVAPKAEILAAMVETGLMPPVVADPGCRDYTGSESMFLTDEKRDIFTQWAALGAPEGRPEQGPELAPEDRSDTGELDLADFDLQLRIPAYTPEFNASGNDYTCFVLDPGNDEDIFITALSPIIDKMEIAHHLVLRADTNGDILETHRDKPFKCFDEDFKDPELNSMANDWTDIAAWGPGGPPIDFGEGRGLRIKAGSALVLQMHYFESSPGASLLEDTSGYAFRTAPAVDEEVFQFYFGVYDFVIPPGAESYSRGAELPIPRTYDTRFNLLGTFPHMHVLGDSYNMWIENSDGTERCITEGEYDFNNQVTYMFQEPATLGPGDTLHMSCTWNNSPSNPDLIHNPPKETVYGEGTDDEMCFFVTYATLEEVR